MSDNLRDEIAVKVLLLLMAVDAPALAELAPEALAGFYAKGAYMVADAMLKERAK